MDFLKIITITCDVIYQKKLYVCLTLGLSWGCDCEGHGPCACGWADGYRTDGCGCVGAHETGIEAHTWSGEQDLCGEVPAFRMNSVSQYKAAAEGCNSSTRYYLLEFQC